MRECCGDYNALLAPVSPYAPGSVVQVGLDQRMGHVVMSRRQHRAARRQHRAAAHRAAADAEPVRTPGRQPAHAYHSQSRYKFKLTAGNAPAG